MLAGMLREVVGWHSTGCWNKCKMYRTGSKTLTAISALQRKHFMQISTSFCWLAIKAVVMKGLSLYIQITGWPSGVLLQCDCWNDLARPVLDAGRLLVHKNSLCVCVCLPLWLALALLFSPSLSQEKDIWACWLQHLCCRTLRLPRRPWVH